MITRPSRRWYRIHKWSSLFCTAFILLMCITGLPLIFRDEIMTSIREQPRVDITSDRQPPANLDVLVEKARGPTGLYPGQVVRWISLEDDRPEVWIGLSASSDADRQYDHSVKFDAQTGDTLQPVPPRRTGLVTMLATILRLHQDLLLGAAGEVVMIVMALFFAVAILSGLVVYGPFLRTLGFGAIRRRRGARIKWLDLHNLTGIAVASWAMVVATTGLMNAVSDIAYDRWRTAAVASALRLHGHEGTDGPPTPVQQVLEIASRAMPGMRVRSIRFPDPELGSPRHFLVWMTGKSHFSARIFRPVLIDAGSGLLVPVDPPPWYLTAIQLSRPLHFGDYGGLPLKIIWALLDLVTIVVLGSGLYLWIARPRRERAAVREGLHGASPAREPAE